MSLISPLSMTADQMSAGSSLIREIPDYDRPRERLERLGAESLSDAEILAIILRTGCKGMSAIQLGEKIIRRFGGLAQLSRCSVDEIASVGGVGRVKAVTCKAAFALHERVVRQETAEIPLDKPEKVAERLMSRCVTLSRETLLGLVLL